MTAAAAISFWLLLVLLAVLFFAGAGRSATPDLPTQNEDEARTSSPESARTSSTTGG